MRFGVGVLQVVAMAALLGGALLLAEGASAQPDYRDLTIAANETLTLADGDFEVEGSITVFGDLVMDNCSLGMKMASTSGEEEIRIQPGGSLTVSDCSMNAIGNLSFYQLVLDQMVEQDPANSSSYEQYYSSLANASAQFRVVLDEGELVLNNVTVSQGRFWMVGGNATMFDVSSSGLNLIYDIGLFIEDTTFLGDGIALADYAVGVRAIGTSPTLLDTSYVNCTVDRTQEWWLTVTVHDTAGALLEGVHVVQRDAEGNTVDIGDPQGDGSSVLWAREYEVVAGVRQDTLSTIFAEKYFGLYSLSGSWTGSITDNQELDLVVNTDTSLIRFSDLQLSVNGASVTPGQSVAKWSTLTINATIENPTDYTLNFGVLLVVNNISGYASGWVALEPRSSAMVTLAWKVSLEGFLVVSVLADDRTMSLPDLRTNSHILVASTAPVAEEEQPWLSLLLLLALAGGAAWALLGEDEEDADAADDEPADDAPEKSVDDESADDESGDESAED